MYDMKIVIPTLMREEEQRAYKQIPDVLREHSYLVTREDRVEILRSFHPDANIISLPMDIEGVAATRQFCIDTLPKGKVWMIDDRCKFHHKRSADMKLLGDINDEEFIELYTTVSGLLEEYTQVGVAERIGNNRFPNDYYECQRVYGCNALRTDTLHRHGIRFDGMYRKDNQIKLYEDFYVVLSILTAGLKNAVIYNFGFTHGGHQKKGGNSTYRTVELQKLCAEALASEFPKFVTVVQKNEKSPWGGMENRWDVRVQWKRAYQDSIQKIDSPEKDNLNTSSASLFDMF